jgi:hypothetical protein
MVRAALIAAALWLAPLTASAQTLAGEWIGFYVCGQGTTALRLTINDVPDEAGLTALFEFGPWPENPDIPSGSFAMRGILIPAADETHDPVLDLRGIEWIEQPHDYVMVDLTGAHQNTPDGDIIAGAVTAQMPFNNCSEFLVRRNPGAPIS